jgi:LmbE family N-acetylglucosaminyl deacetylase
MNIVAHQDDDLIFQNPDLLEAIAAGDCVRTVFVTAGDAGLGTAYWHAREEGSRAAYAQMAGVANTWTSSEPVVAGHTLHVSTLNGNPMLSEVYLRLPNGGPNGTGYAATGFASLPKLWRSHNPQPAGLTPLSELSALDGSATYTYEGLLGTLEGLIAEFEPDLLSTQDFVDEFDTGDHADHIATAKFVDLADASYGREHELRSYVDYGSKNSPINVFEPQLAKKLSAYYTYAAYDGNEACSSQAKCEEPAYADYWAWLKRQIVVSDTSVPGADAGSPQSVASNAQVTLDGSASSDPLGHPLSYEWKQSGGTAVTLSGSTAVKPTFTAPTGPATLTFSLVVRSSEASGLAASVTVSVAAPEPPPPPPDPFVAPQIPRTTIETIAGRASKHVIPVSGSPTPDISCEARLPAGAYCRVRPNGEVVIRIGRRTDAAGFFRAHVIASNSAGTAREPVDVVIRPDPEAPLRVDLSVPAPSI